MYGSMVVYILNHKVRSCLLCCIMFMHCWMADFIKSHWLCHVRFSGPLDSEASAGHLLWCLLDW